MRLWTATLLLRFAVGQQTSTSARHTPATVLALLAGAPDEPADRAAYLVLIGQPAHHAALDPDSTLLALAYRAAPPDVRARLRAALAAAGDSEVIRVVVTGEARDRLGELSYDELDYLRWQLAERQGWNGLRRLARHRAQGRRSDDGEQRHRHQPRRGRDGMSRMQTCRAAVVLRLPLRKNSARRSAALDTVVRAAASGAPGALRRVARLMERQGGEAVWQAWLAQLGAETPPRAWDSPVVAELLTRAVPVPEAVVDTAWRDWLYLHDDALWSLLQRWNRPATGFRAHVPLSRLALGDEEAEIPPDVLADAAGRFDHPIGAVARARLLTASDPAAVDLFCELTMANRPPEAIAFCVGHHLAPSDEVRRALFFACTGQQDQYWALDPEGTLLALGYGGAVAREREVLREAMTALGGIDVLRVLAGRSAGRGDLASLNKKERAHLVGQLAERREWNQLWSLTRWLPLAEAAHTTRAFGDWRPSADDERAVFEALRAAHPPQLRTCVGDFRARILPHSRISLSDFDRSMMHVHDLGFSPDGTQLAFVTGGIYPHAGIVDLRSRTLTRLHSGFADPVKRVAHLGSDALAVVSKSPGKGTHAHARYQVYRADHKGLRDLRFIDGSATRITVRSVDRLSGDHAFAVTAWAYNPSGERELAMYVPGPGKTLVRSHQDADLAGGSLAFTAIRPDSRRIAFLGGDSHEYAVITDVTGSDVTRLHSGPRLVRGTPEYVALSPSALVRCSVASALTVWREPFDSVTPPRRYFMWPTPEGARIGIFWSAALNRFLGVTSRQLELLDIQSATDGDPPARLTPETVTFPGLRYAWTGQPVRLSPQGDVLATAGQDDTVDLHFLAPLALRTVIGRPVGLMPTRTLNDVTAALEAPLSDNHRGTLELLQVCLEHRFRHDVGIDDVTGATAVCDSEIELGG
jgi:hypothetical protein